MNDTKTLIPLSLLSKDSPSSNSRWLLAAFLCVGAAAGTLFGRLVPLGFTESISRFLSSDFSGPADLLWLLWILSWPCLVSVFLASSFIGFLFLPLLFIGRGFLISSGISILLCSGWDALRTGAMIGLPALFSLTALFLIGEKSFDASRNLFRLCAGKPSVPYSFIPSERQIASAVLLFMAALTRQFLIPLLR